MERVAFILGEWVINWSSVILALSALAALCLFLGLYLGESGNVRAAFAAAPLAVLLSLAAARWLHWYCYGESYESLSKAMTDLSGGFCLAGAFGGCLSAALVTRLLCLHRNLPQMLDCMSVAGCGGIAAGRLSCFYNAADRGQEISSLWTVPWGYPLTNSVSGETEYRLATFLHQAMVAGILFAVLFFLYLLRKKRRRDGDTALIFLLWYGATQILLDSMRYDSLYFHFNGFISIVQVLSLGAVVLTVILFSVRLVKNRGYRRWYGWLWGLMLVLLGVAGYMEYHVQRHGNEALFAYSVMGSCIGLVVLLTLLIRGISGRGRGAWEAVSESKNRLL